MAYVSIDSGSGPKPWDNIEWRYPEDYIINMGGVDSPNGRTGDGWTDIYVKKECATTVTARVKKGNTYLNIDKTIPIAGITQIEHYNYTLPSAKHLYPMPLPLQAYIPDVLNTDDTVQVMGKHGDALFVKNIGQSGGGNWNYGFLYDGIGISLDAMKLSDKGAQLLADLEGGDLIDPGYIQRDSNNDMLAIKNRDIGDGGITVGYGTFIPHGSAGNAKRQMLLDTYGIDATINVWVPRDKVLKLYKDEQVGYCQLAITRIKAWARNQ